MQKALKKIVFLMPYFGQWPEWFPLYLESCRWNPTIDWLFFTDCLVPENVPPNVLFISMSFQDYQKLASDRLDIVFETESSYALCNLKPTYGLIHQEYVEGYDYVGFGDIDVIYGDLRAFYTDEILRYNTLSTHEKRVSAHLFLIKNDEQWINAFRKIPNWQEQISRPFNSGVDEPAFTKVLRGSMRISNALSQVWGVFDPYKRNHLFQERHSTVLASIRWLDGSYNHPTQWFWHRGKLTVESGEEMMYLHFMNWKSSRYLPKIHGDKAAWELLPRLIDPNLTNPAQGFCISPSGFTPLSNESYLERLRQAV